MPRRENRPASLECNSCGQPFVAPVPHEAIESDERHIIGWVPAKGSTSGVACPSCGSRPVGLQR